MSWLLLLKLGPTVYFPPHWLQLLVTSSVVLFLGWFRLPPGLRSGSTVRFDP